MKWPRRNPVRGHGPGAATHNGNGHPGRLEVTVWGWTDLEWGRLRRDMAITLDEAAAQRLVNNLALFGFYAGRAPDMTTGGAAEASVRTCRYCEKRIQRNVWFGPDGDAQGQAWGLLGVSGSATTDCHDAPEGQHEPA